MSSRTTQITAPSRPAFGDDSEPVARSTANLGTVYWADGNDAAAIPKFEEAVEKLARFLGPDHPDVGSTLITLSNSLLRTGRLEEAERMARRGLKIRMAKFDASSVPVAGGRLRLGQVLVARKKYAEADGLLRQAAEVFHAETGPSGPNTQLAIKTRALPEDGTDRGRARAGGAADAEVTLPRRAFCACDPDPDRIEGSGNPAALLNAIHVDGLVFAARTRG